MDVSELIDRLTWMGARISAEGDEVAVRFPEELRREVEELAPTIRELKPRLLRALRDQTGEPCHELKDIELGLKICGQLASLPAHRSATAVEIAEAFHGRDYALDRVFEVYRVCEELRQAGILTRGRDGYGYQCLLRQ
jgi:hypothetical protein